MSGRGRKQAHRGGSKRSQPSSKRSAVTRSPKAAPAAVSSAAPTGGGSRRLSRAAAEAALQARAARRKRNQRIGVLIGAMALAGALVGSVFLGQRGGSTAAAQNDGATTTSAAPHTRATPTTSAAPAPTTPVSPMVITCPTSGGATVVFGHEITVPEPYTVTITYGDDDEYTNDSAHLGAIFSHTYKKAGTYAVHADLTAPGGTTATADCSYTWGP